MVWLQHMNRAVYDICTAIRHSRNEIVFDYHYHHLLNSFPEEVADALEQYIRTNFLS